MHGLFYNLKKKPFQLDHDPNYFFESGGQKRALSYLHYGLTQREGFVVITGEHGVGKTMLSHVFFHSLNRDNIVAALIVFDKPSAEEALRLITKAFSLPYENLSKATLLKNLEAFFLEQVKNGKQVLLVVDEVQRLSMRLLEELRMLSNFTLDGRALLQTFLLGHTDFKATLQDERLEQLRQRVIAAYQLEAMSQEETRAYVDSRLQHAGWQGEALFDGAAYAKIYEYSQGVPKTVNTLCECTLQLGYKNKVKKFDEQLVQQAVKALQGGGSLKDETVEYIVASEPLKTEDRPKGASIEEKVLNNPVVKNSSSDFEERLTTLERRITELEEQLKKERKRIKKLILLMDDE